MAEFLVVVVDGGDGEDAGVFVGGVVLFVGGLEPVEDAADEWGDEFHAGVGAGDGLGKREEEREVAVDAVLLELAGGLDAFPCGSNLDEDAVPGEAFFFVHADELARLGDGAVGIEGEAGIDFRGDATGDDAEDFASEEDEDAVDDAFDELISAEWAVAVFRDGLIDERAVLGFFGRLEDKGGIGGGVLREEGAHGFEVAGICDDGGDLLEGFELVHGDGKTQRFCRRDWTTGVAGATGSLGTGWNELGACGSDESGFRQRETLAQMVGCATLLETSERSDEPWTGASGSPPGDGGERE